MSELGKKIRKLMVEAIADYAMLAEGDRVLVAVSGGKDSSVMLHLLEQVRQRAPFHFSLEAILLDQKQPGFAAKDFAGWVESLGVRLHLIEEDTYTIVKTKTKPGKAYCSLCSRLRRGVLYNFAHKHGFNKIAIGHHRDDLNETILMNLFYAGQIAAMPPKLRSDDGRNVVIRPMSYVPENWLIGYSHELKIPLIPCQLCGSQDGLKRKKIKQLLQHLTDDNGNVPGSMLRAMRNVRPSQLMDRSLWQFTE